MAYSYARRKELAALKLRAVGITPGKDPAGQWRKATADLRQHATTALAGRDRTYKGGGAFRPGRSAEQAIQRQGGKRAKKERVIPNLDAKIITSRDQRAIRKALRDAQSEGKRVVVYVTIDKGRGPRERVIDGHGAQGDQLRQGAGGGGGGGGGEGAGGDVVGKLRIVSAPIGSPAFGKGSVDPADLLDYLDAYEGDWWDAWFDLADADYFAA